MNTAALGAIGPRLMAHQGGWDEALMVAGPIAVIAGLLWLAKRRVDATADGVARGREPDPD